MSGFVTLTAQNGELFSNNSSVGSGTGSFQYLVTSSSNIEIDTDAIMTIYNNNPQYKYNALGSGLNRPVRSLALDSNNNLYVGGDFTDAGGIPAHYIAKWSGSTWYALGGGLNGSVRSLALDSSNNLYVGGNFTRAGGIGGKISHNIAKWNGSTWYALGNGRGLNGSVTSLALDSNNNLYVGGYFTQAGGIPANNIAKWSGATWYALGGGLNDSVASLAFDSNNNLYVGGYFIDAGGIPANNIAKWDGSTWSALDNGLDDSVKSLAFDSNNNLYVGGDFTHAGGILANNIANLETNTSVDIHINNNYISTLVSNQFQCVNYYKSNGYIYKTTQGYR